jgi:uncharacterized alpha-E superfamily protein
MLLSRLAEAVYWAGRYLERAEAAARLVQVHTSLYMDLPRVAGVDWTSLLVVTGAGEPFDAVYPAAAEDDVVRFLTIDSRNPTAIVASLERARHNLRATRALFPREVWESVNTLYLTAVEDADHAVPRSTRDRWLGAVVAECQRLTGITNSAMSRDEAYAFLWLGRNVERADMTTRVLDVCAATFHRADDHLRPYADVTWMSVLKSVQAYTTYRRRNHSRTRGADTLAFLLRDPQFPRSVQHCLIEISRCLVELPRSADALSGCAAAETLVADTPTVTATWRGLHELTDRVQGALSDIHEAIGETYFSPDPVAVPALAS